MQNRALVPADSEVCEGTRDQRGLVRLSASGAGMLVAGDQSSQWETGLGSLPSVQTGGWRCTVRMSYHTEPDWLVAGVTGCHANAGLGMGRVQEGTAEAHAHQERHGSGVQGAAQPLGCCVMGAPGSYAASAELVRGLAGAGRVELAGVLLAGGMAVLPLHWAPLSSPAVEPGWSLELGGAG